MHIDNTAARAQLLALSSKKGQPEEETGQSRVINGFYVKEDSMSDLCQRFDVEEGS